MDLTDVLIALLVVLAGFGLWLTGTALTIWGERRVVAKMQTRIGPNRVGPLGILQTLADGIKLFFKEDITPEAADKFTYYVAPMLSAVVAMLTFAVIPFGGTFEVGDREVTMQIWDPEIGLLWVLAMSSLSVYGIALGGWASGSKYPLLGGVRSSAQMISYELAMGLGLAAVFIWTGTLQVSEIVEAQSGTFFGFLPAWNIGPQIFAFVLFFVAAVAETQRPPFDLPEAEGELVAGFVTEYSGAKFAMFFLGEFMQMVTMSAVTVTVFFGGPNGPLFGLEGTLLGALLAHFYFLIKTVAFVFVFIWLRGTLPRFTYNRLMDLGWKVFLPLGLLWVMLTAAIVVAQETLAQDELLFGIGVVLAVLIALLLVSMLFERRGPEPEDEDAEPTDQSALPSAAETAREAAERRGAKQIEVDV
ncbi:NADH-quinone oxidoreductase subunit NuoH [Egibacter rhizosphaerae]|uniref:NADH-quinone oxidoreductase subunit H n=1 Tax=Egibacter rhizosphaerae TaxID=1670831 RepID=A0A411YGI0_9ACTN|nr:NADH-quinone oxidoreductase subunit NuoH [Egibacter rhizosphaerae]QBI20364.1 NADH-quinone oxidoreductase subunit NuoH [Egibacter rhizosphaerae]